MTKVSNALRNLGHTVTRFANSNGPCGGPLETLWRSIGHCGGPLETLWRPIGHCGPPQGFQWTLVKWTFTMSIGPPQRLMSMTNQVDLYKVSPSTQQVCHDQPTRFVMTKVHCRLVGHDKPVTCLVCLNTVLKPWYTAHTESLAVHVNLN